MNYPHKTCNCYSGNYMMYCDSCKNGRRRKPPQLISEITHKSRLRIVGDCVKCRKICPRCSICHSVICEFCVVPGLKKFVCIPCFTKNLDNV